MRRQLGLQSSEIIFTHYSKYLKLPRMCILIGMIILLRRSLDELLEQYQHPVTLKTASNPNVVALSLTNTAFLFCLGKKKSGKKKKAGRIYISLLTSLFSLIPDVNFLCFFYDPFILDSTFFCSVSRNFCCYWCQLYLCDVL